MITFALAKGRLAKESLQLLEEAGYPVGGLIEKAGRKLLFETEDGEMRFFLAKAGDVPTYVEYGAADIGIVGKDTLLEEDRELCEVLDLGLGKCRMCICGPKEADALLQGRRQIRIASKYPKITKDYFESVRHQGVEIIKLNGSVELSPIVGLSDMIVDIVETGSTLRENGLTVLQEMIPLSARLVINPVSMRMKREETERLLKALRETVKRREEDADTDL